MDVITSNFFVIPMAVGSSILFGISAFSSDGQFNPFEENNIHEYDIYVNYLIGFSFFYFVFDFFMLLYRFSPKNYPYFLHHFVGISSLCVVQFQYFQFIKYLLGYLAYELSTPFLNMCLRHRQLKIYNNWTRMWRLLFVISYTLIRIIFGSFMTYELIKSLVNSDSSIINSLIIFPITLQSLIYWWYSKILKMYYKK